MLSSVFAVPPRTTSTISPFTPSEKSLLASSAVPLKTSSWSLVSSLHTATGVPEGSSLSVFPSRCGDSKSTKVDGSVATRSSNSLRSLPLRGGKPVKTTVSAGGPSALTTALVASGLPADTVVFTGFPPRKGRERKELLGRVATEPSTFVLFESPHRLVKTLRDLPSGTPVAVCRELTKLYEEIFRGTAEEATRHFSERVKGE